jgi:hypothetical protein
VCSQIQVNQFPDDLQVIGRQHNQKEGVLHISGTIKQGVHTGDSLVLRIYRNQLPFIMRTLRIGTFSSASASDTFSFEERLPAEFANFSIELILTREGRETLLRKAENVVVGDVIVIQGQSNAEARKFEGSVSHLQSSFIRTFGGSFESVDQHKNHLKWYEANGDLGNGNPGAIGQWGLYLAKHLSDSLGYPIAVLNGAYGGREIAYFQKDYKSLTAEINNYHRLLERVEKSGLKDFVRIICWAQGENDAYKKHNLPYYKSQFTTLQENWKRDFPTVNQIFLFQTAFACRVTAFGYSHIAEAQRQLAVKDSMLFLIPTNDLQLHTDVCHFPYSDGYEEFGKRILSNVLCHGYRKKQKRVLSTPDILEIAFKDEQTLFLTFSESLDHASEASAQFMLVGIENLYSQHIEVRANTLTIYFDQRIKEGCLLVYLPSKNRPGKAIKSKKSMPIPSFVRRVV